MWYRNISNSEKTFYGVTFQPGEVKEVNGIINHKDFYVTDPPKVEKQEKKTTKLEHKSEELETSTVEPISKIV